MRYFTTLKQTYIDLCRRFIRDEECRRQKEKEQNQLKQKKQPKVTLNSFFQKKTSPSTKNKDSDKPRTKASPSSEEIINIENDEDVIDKAIAEGRCEVICHSII